MKVHGNAKLHPNGRLLMCQRVIEQGWSLTEAAEAAGVSERTCSKWLARYRSEGRVGLLDRSSAPKRIPHRTPEPVVKAITALRRLRMTAAEIAEVLGLALSTVSLWCKRVGLGKRSALAPPEPPNRYERSRPGELIHVDVKKLGRFGVAGKRAIGNRSSSRGYGWECVHVCVDDATRLAYVEVLPDERGETAVGFLRRAVAWLAERGVGVERVMTDNGSPYRSVLHARACRELGIRHLRTQPYRPRTNGKAERFIQTMLREWAYGRIYGSSAERSSQLAGWLDRYNYRRKHGSLGHRPPAARLNELLGNNLVGNY
ncbi:MAG TPA: IS481 family transposase, partial [Gemmatimonadales bacterium]|nr:IS481 family transposase [Gemmatimonadales bacterium]